MFQRVSFLACFLGLAVLFAAAGCNDNNGPADNFDRQAMLRNYADNLIKPAFADLQTQTNALLAAVESFKSDLTPLRLASLQTAWGGAYVAWQYANAFNFGPAGEEGLRKDLIEEIGTFPASELKMENAVSAGAWNLQDFNRDARGFLAIEYLIFGKNQTPEEIIQAFSQSPNRRNYLTALAENLRDRVADVATAWNGPYGDEFVENDGTDVGSSTSALYNEFVRSYESIKNFKLGLPLGKRPGQTQAEPHLVEAYYSGTSLAVLKLNFSAIENIWYGRAKDGSDGIGFREYLENVEGGQALIANTETQIVALKAALAAVPTAPSLSEQIAAGNHPQLDALYVEFSKMTRFFKSDMSSLLGIAITFSSGDGD